MRIGVFGGTFDPIHKGHVAVAQCALRAGLNRVLFLPEPQKTPLRELVAPAKERVKLCRLAAHEDKRLGVCTLEADKQEHVSRLETLKKLNREYPSARLTLILGADRLPLLLHLEEREKLFALCDFLVCPRAGVSHAETFEKLQAAGAQVELLDMPFVAGSAPLIQAQLQAFDDPDALPEAVAIEIAQTGLYHDETLLTVRDRMNEKRFRHTLGVRQEAVKLAALHGVSLQKAALAAMLHDCAKALPFEEMLALAKEAGIEDENILSSPALLHGPVGAYIAKTRYHVRLDEVLDAIYGHTVGHAQMTPLELCIFVADATEPHREPYPGLKRLRKLAQTSLAAAALLSLNLTKEYLLSRGKAFNPLSNATVLWLEQVVPEELKALTVASVR